MNQTAKRRLHAYTVGDFWKGKVVPKIRLQGKWLTEAGIQPGDEILIEIQGDGVLLIRRCDKEQD